MNHILTAWLASVTESAYEPGVVIAPVSGRSATGRNNRKENGHSEECKDTLEHVCLARTILSRSKKKQDEQSCFGPLLVAKFE